MNKRVQKGYVVLVLAILFAAVGMALVLGGAVPIISHVATTRGYGYSKQAFLATNSAVNEAIYRLMNNQILPASVTIDLGSSTATISTISTPTGKKMTVVGSSTASYQRSVVADDSYSAGVAFNYGLQAGLDGVDMGGGSTVNGNVYSNGPIEATSATITGTAISAGSNGFIGGANYVGGVVIGLAGVGNAWANEVKGALVAGNLYCNTGSSNNKACDASKGTPPIVELPYTDQNITDWKNDAKTGGTIEGDYDVNWQGATLGPKEITGDLTISGGGTLTMTGTLYVHGNVSVSGGGKIQLPESFGENSATIVSDGRMNINGGGSVGSGNSSSYLFLVTTSSCPDGPNCGGNNSAIRVTGGAGTIAVSAQNGTVELSGGCVLKAATAKFLKLSGGSTVNYDSGLAAPQFNSGPSGGYAIVNWREY